MLVGEDYPKIEFQFNGWDLLEPDSFIGDLALGIIAIYLGYRCVKYFNMVISPYFYNYTSLH